MARTHAADQGHRRASRVVPGEIVTPDDRAYDVASCVEPRHRQSAQNHRPMRDVGRRCGRSAPSQVVGSRKAMTSAANRERQVVLSEGARPISVQ